MFYTLYSPLEIVRCVFIHLAVVGIGGEVLVSSGISSEGSSGRIEMSSPSSGPHGVSGDVLVASGHSEAGTSGMVTLQTGSSKTAAGGSLSLQIGDGGGMANGGDILLTAGLTSAQGKKGGKCQKVICVNVATYQTANTTIPYSLCVKQCRCC